MCSCRFKGRTLFLRDLANLKANEEQFRNHLSLTLISENSVLRAKVTRPCSQLQGLSSALTAVVARLRNSELSPTELNILPDRI